MNQLDSEMELSSQDRDKPVRHGLSKLEIFTMAAMQGFAANPSVGEMKNFEIAAYAVDLAIRTLDALGENE